MLSAKLDVGMIVKLNKSTNYGNIIINYWNYWCIFFLLRSLDDHHHRRRPHHHHHRSNGSNSSVTLQKRAGPNVLQSVNEQLL